PDAHRLLGLREKQVLRRAVRGLVPEAIRTRVKQPYRAPIASALAGPSAPDYVRDLLSPRALADVGLFDVDAVPRLARKADADDGRRLTETEEMALVGVVSSMLLHEQFVSSPAPAPAVVPQRVVTPESQGAALA